MVKSFDNSVVAAFLRLIRSNFPPLLRCEEMFGQIFGLRRPELICLVKIFPFAGLRQHKKRIIKS
jgi:hypothetical protein